MSRVDLNIQTGECVETVHKEADNLFNVKTQNGLFRARTVVLAQGRAGTPRKLGIKGEELPHVLYRLIEADHYTNQNILIVGGGDSAVEAAMGLARQPGNRVTLSYRRGEFTRLKDRNAKRIDEHMRSGKVEVLFNSNPIEFTAGKTIMKTESSAREIPSDFVWIFAGGTPPTDFLKSVGIAFGSNNTQ